MVRLIVFCVTLLLALPSFAQTDIKTEEQKTFYAVGLAIAKQIEVFNFTPDELAIVQQAITDAGTGKKTEVDLAAYNEKVQILARARRKAEGDKLAAAGKEFLEKAAKEKDGKPSQFDTPDKTVESIETIFIKELGNPCRPDLFLAAAEKISCRGI